MTTELIAGQRLAVEDFQRLLLGKEISPRIALALKLHLCEGVRVVDACKRSGASRPGFYRARAALDVGPTPPEFVDLTFPVPVHRAELLNSMISYQLQLWAAEDETAAHKASEAIAQAAMASGGTRH